MKSFLTIALATFISSSAFAETGDLTLPGEKWLAKFNGYVCSETSGKVAAPKGFTKFNVQFETLTTDMTLDNGLIKGTFVEAGKACRYSAIVFADNALKTSRLVESRAFATEDFTECSEGKKVIDAAFESNDYLYYGKPHSVSFMGPVEGAEEICPDTSLVGITFITAGRISK